MTMGEDNKGNAVQEEASADPLSEPKEGATPLHRDRDDSLDNYFDSSTRLHHMESLDYFDAMEVLYYDDILQQQESIAESTSTSSCSEEGEYEAFEKWITSDSEVNENDNREQNLVREIKGSVRRNRKRLHRLAREKRQKLQHTIVSRRKKLKKIMSEPQFVMTMDKISFVCGVLIIMIIEAVLLLAPSKMGALYTTLLVPLMLARYIIYKQDLYHYFMYDFCYFAQILLLVHMYKYPDNVELGKALFSIANGPLASAIIMWRNSLVFHSMDKMTSMYIHILPALVMFSKRWGDHFVNKDFPWYENMDGTFVSNIKEFWWNPFCYYILWQTIYLVKTEVISKRKLAYNTDLMTSLRWMTKKKDSSSYKLLSVFGEHNQLPTFVAIQAAYTLVTFLGIPLLWHSIWLHSLYLAVIFVIALKNGATYYFHVFAKRYIEEIGKRVSEENEETKEKIVNA